MCPNDTTPVKRCSKCKQEFPSTTEYFYAEKRRGPHALRCSCKACFKAHAERTRDPEKRKEYQQRWAEQNREKRRRANREWRARNLASQRKRERTVKQADPRRHEKWAEYRRKNPHILRRQMRKYRENNRAKLLLIVHRYRARKQSLPDDFTPDDWQFALDYFDGCCAVCNRPPGLFHVLAMDHFIPLASDDCPGTVPTNIVPLCHGDGGCNNSKHDRDPAQWVVDKFGQKQGRAILAKIQEFFSLVRD